METTFNNFFSGKIIIPLLITLAFFLLGFFLLKKTQQLEKTNVFANELTIDTVTDSRALGYAGQRKIVSDSKGNIFLGYRKNYQNNAEIFVAEVSRDSNGLHITGTDKPIAVVGKNDDQRVPSLAVDQKNMVHAVWYGSDTQDVKNNRQIKYSRKSASATNWESWRNIAYVSGYTNGTYWQEHPMLLVGQGNMLYVTWEGQDEQNSNQQIKFIRSENNGTTWTTWKNVQPTPNNTQSRPTLVEDKTGKLFLFMYSSQGTNSDQQQIQYSTSSDKGDTWTPWQTISDPTFDARHISAAIDSTGKIYVAWRAQIVQNGPTQIVYRTFSANSWSDQAVVSPSNNYQFFPSIGITDSGIAYISWMENSDPSGYPREDPTGGSGLVAFFRNGKFQPPQTLSSQANVLYPNVSEKTADETIIPVFSAQDQGNNQFDLKLKFFNGTT